MARKGNILFEDNLDSNCTESFMDDVDLVVDRRCNYAIQKGTYKTEKKYLDARIKKAEQALRDAVAMPENQQDSFIFDLSSAYEDLSCQFAEDAYKQGFKDAMQLMFMTNN